MPQRYLLSIDSGGIRGVIPTIALVKLERTTSKLTRDIFSFVAGTSTGAIIAAAIAAGIPATRILEFYTQRATDLFNRSPLKFLKLILLGYRYSTQNLHHLIAEALAPADIWTLNDSPIDILLTAK